MTAYDRRGRRIDLDSWTLLFEDRDYKRVARTEVEAYVVSTVWLGLDHSFGFGVPLIFETMVFAGDGDGNVACYGGVEQRRYPTEEGARAGHEETVEEVRQAVAAMHDAAKIVVTEAERIVADRKG